MGLLNRLDKKLQGWGDRLDLMQEMADKCGAASAITPRDDTATSVRGAILTCLRCGEAKTCASWLASAETGATPPAFCPNATRFAAHREEQAS
ncbi:MAG: DUF6455 family protein [Sulfitobacter sp.]|nr:DUF6455 family protein [Sulfitobacter sp.]